MVREVGCSTNLALWQGFMAATSRTMVKWSASFGVRELRGSANRLTACVTGLPVTRSAWAKNGGFPDEA